MKKALLTWILLIFAGNSLAMHKLIQNSHHFEPFVKASISIGSVYLDPTVFFRLFLQYQKVAPKMFAIPSLLFFACFLAGVVVSLLFAKIGQPKERTSEGTAKWATRDEMIQAKVLVSSLDMDDHSGIVCGILKSGRVDYDELRAKLKSLPYPFLWLVLKICQVTGISRKEYILDEAKTHLLLTAPSRAGKGVGAISHTLLHWKDSVVVADPKRENLDWTAGFREKYLNQNIIEFSPTDTRPTHRFNPINEVRWGTANEGKDVENLVKIIVGEGNEKDKHWIENATSLIIGILTHLKYQHAIANEKMNVKPGDLNYIETNFYHVYEFLATSLDEDGDPEPFAEKLEREIKKDHFPTVLWTQNITSDLPYLRKKMNPEEAFKCFTYTEETKKAPMKHPTVVNRFSSFLSKPANEGGSVLSTAVTALGIFQEKIIADNTATSDFFLGDIRSKDKPTTLYLVIPPADLLRVGPLFRLIFDFITTKGTEFLDSPLNKHKCLLLIDEFPAYGKMTKFVQTLGYTAGYGYKTMLVVQGLDQITALYDKNLQILTNAQTQIYLGPKDETSKKTLSESLGKSTQLLKQESYQKTWFFKKKNISEVEKGRNLLNPDECDSLLDKLKAGVVIIEGLKIMFPRVGWFQNPEFEWRVKYSQKVNAEGKIGIREEMR